MFVLLTGLVIAVLDQVTKQAVRGSFHVGESLAIVPGFFNLTHIRNTGAAWGILGGQNLALAALSVIMLVLMAIFRRSFLTRAWEHQLALGLLIGGIVGNLMDRLRLDGVTDFLDFYWRGYHWPSFNIADSAICMGVALYIVSSLWISGHPLHESQLKGASSGPETSTPEKPPAAGGQG